MNPFTLIWGDLGSKEWVDPLYLDLCISEGEDDMVVSGWGDPGVRMREDLLKEWGDIFERWDGKERGRPSKVTKLCRKVCLCVKGMFVCERYVCV